MLQFFVYYVDLFVYLYLFNVLCEPEALDSKIPIPPTLFLWGPDPP